jgi:hypothetical protein
MLVITHISRNGLPVADITYRAGLFVEVRVAKEVQNERVSFKLFHSDNKPLEGTWEESLDKYFNDGTFELRDNLFRGEMPRYGAARDHRLLFHKASYALMKDLAPHGLKIEIEFE